jgi:D-amino-acid dehydrogenase
MKSIVLGGGVVGVTTAYYLAKGGHEVHVVDAANEVGADATGGNAGLIAPAHSFAWASPRAPGMLLRSLFGEATAIRLKLKPDPRMWSWLLAFLRECTAERAQRNTLIKLRLCLYSQECLNKLAQEENIDYHAVNKGVLFLFREPEGLQAEVSRMSLLAEYGHKHEVLDAGAVLKLEPALEPVKHRIVGAVHAPNDASGNAQLFTRSLAKVCEGLGVTFELGRKVRALTADRNRITGVVTDNGRLHGDYYVLSLGVGSPRLVRTIGVKLPIYPCKGYSATFPIDDRHAPPTIGGVDEETLVGWSRRADRLRMTSTAEFAGHDRHWRAKDFSSVLRVARELLPKAADYTRGDYRACLRPMTPDGPPVLGRGPHQNLYYNTGQGHIGWTMACGSSRAVADLVLGQMPEIDLAGNEYRWR